MTLHCCYQYNKMRWVIKMMPWQIHNYCPMESRWYMKCCAPSSIFHSSMIPYEIVVITFLENQVIFSQIPPFCQSELHFSCHHDIQPLNLYFITWMKFSVCSKVHHKPSSVIRYISRNPKVDFLE